MATDISVSVNESLFDSDHFPIELRVLGSPIVLPEIKLYRWGKICSEINRNCSERSSINCEEFTDMVKGAMNKFSVIRNRSNRSVPNWWTARCENLLRQKRFLLKKARRELSVSWWLKYKQASAKLRAVIMDCKRKFWDDICKNAKDPSLLFKILRGLQRKQKEFPVNNNVLLWDGRYVSNDKIQANIMAIHFRGNANHDPIPIDYGDSSNEQLNRDFTMEELTKSIKNIKIKSPGEDRISAALFKGLDLNACQLLLSIYNQIWNSGDIPESWKSALVLPISKPGKDKKYVGSYRPIALTSVMTKICEKMIANRISWYILENDIMCSGHFGFLPFRDCQVALSSLHQDIIRGRNEKKFILGVSLDIQGAYDSVYIDGLIWKCAQLGIKGKILRWIHQFIQNRVFKVKWRNCISDVFHNKKGVPQGSVLSPILFTIFMQDLYEELSADVKCIVYADDIFLYSINKESSNCRNKLQDALQVINKWCKIWKMEINMEKSNSINLSRRRDRGILPPSMNGIRIEWKKEVKFLGVLFSNRGGFLNHVTQVKSKLMKKINILKIISNKKYGARSKHLVRLVNANIRGSLEYGAIVLAKCKPTIINKLDVLLNRALRIALGLPCWVPNIVLRKHGAITDMKSRLEYLERNFWLKQFSLRCWSPIWRNILSQESDREYIFKNNIEELLTGWDVEYDHFLDFQIPREYRKEVKFMINEQKFQDKSLSEKEVKVYFEEFLDNYRDKYNIIATDASKSANNTGIAGCSKYSQFCYRVNNICSIFTAEAIAMGSACDELLCSEEPILMLTDSLSTISALKNINIHSSMVILWLHQKLHKTAERVEKFIVCWVPGHRGIVLNERADNLCKQVNSLDVLMEWVDLKDLVHENKKCLKEKIATDFVSSKYVSKLGNIPDINITGNWGSNRREDVWITRIICHMMVTPELLGKFKMLDSNQCNVCKKVDSLYHIVMECGKYKKLRQECWRPCWNKFCQISSRVDFGGVFCSCAVFRCCSLRFLKLIGRF